MTGEFSEAKACFEQNQLTRSLEILNELVLANTNDLNALLLRARIYYKMQLWGDAMNDYWVVLELDAENNEAKSGLEMAQNILGYFTPDLFNP